jgi:hypothetical protein
MFEMNNLLEAKFQLESLLHKLEETYKTLYIKQSGKSHQAQITLTMRRVKAIQLSIELIDIEIKNQVAQGEK